MTGCCEGGNDTSGFKEQGNNWVAEQLSVSHEKLLHGVS